MAAGAGDSDLKAAAAEGLRNGGVGASAVENDVGHDAAGKRSLIVEVTHAAQVAFAFFADVGENDKGRSQFNLGLDERGDDGEHAGDAGGVVAGSGGGEAVLPLTRLTTGLRGVSAGKDRVEMRRENNDGSAAFGREFGGGEESEDIADGVGLDVGEASFGEAGGNPLGASLFAERRGGNGNQFRSANP